ncbi:DUF6443 domain-containing protein [Chryseobacterium sp. SIMBA_028]|uniref:DUF6443 domain-containing protein n=2 Tax=Pseudomonadati TaxID=3379134 RepID=UPI00397851BC
MKKIIIPIGMLLITQLVQAQLTPTENYIQTKIYLDYNGTSPTKTSETVQYFDGLGRPKQVVNVKASPLGRDVVTKIEYDGFGRQVLDYLPVPQANTMNGAIIADPLSNAAQPGIYGSEKIYSEKILESSPLSRIQQQIQVGTDWANKPVKFQYEANTTGEVKKFTTTTSWVNGATQSTVSPATDPNSENGFYKSGQLYKNVVTDEDENKTIEFKNGKGQTILVRKVLSATENADTYYVYNEYDQLAFVIPPLASVSGSLSPSTLDNLYYQYRYDGKNRLVEKKLPGKDWEFMVYDKQDRIVLVQDGNLRTINTNFGAKGWIFTKYDKLGRTVYTGFFANTDKRHVIQDLVNTMASNAGNNEETSSTPIVQNDMNIYYTKKVFPTESIAILTVKYYDEYPPDLPLLQSGPVLGQGVLTPTPMEINGVMTSRSTKGLPTASYVRNITDTNWTRDYIWYDLKGREIQTHSINHLGGYTRTESKLDFAGVPQTVVTRHKRLNTDTERIITENFEYDHQNRLLVHKHQVDSNPVEILAQNKYNELSQLINKKVGNNLQSMDYAYNIRGWMTDINKNDMSAPTLNGKLFSYKIKYNHKNGTTNPDQALFIGKNVKPMYNGNIVEVDWRTMESPGANPPLEPKRYSYAYDTLNRLTAGYYQNPNNPWSKEHTEAIDYDLNGNITNMYRTSVIENSTTATVIDRLTYNYTGNRLTSINDISTNPSGYEGGGNTITYDPNGNMENMRDKKLTSIKYNFLNLPQRIEVSGLQDGAIGYKYTANGTKLQKTNSMMECGITNCYTVNTVSDYLDGFQYVNRTTTGGGSTELLLASREMSKAMETQAYTMDGIIKPLEPGIDPPIGGGGGLIVVPAKDEDLVFFPTAEGYYDYKKDQYIYQYKDHLGNARVSFAKNSAGALEITDANDYYPFGMNHLKTGNSFYGQGSYKNYKYNGKELQETGMYAMDFRHYMPDIGRFTGMDRLSEILPTLTPYRFGFDNPVNFSDPTGLFETRREAREYRREHDISGGITKNKDGSYSINDKTNHVSYTKGTEGSSETYANDGVQESALIIASGKPKETTNWYGPGGQANWAFGTGATLSGFKGVLNSDQMYSQGIRRGLSGNYQLTGRNLSLFGKSAMTDATVPISKFGKWGGIAGKASFFAGVAMDGVGVYNYTQNPNSPNAVHPAKAGLNTTMGAIGVWGGPPGAVVSAAYFGIDAFYPGGWAGAAADQDRLYQENKAINPDYQMFPGAMKQ